MLASANHHLATATVAFLAAVTVCLLLLTSDRSLADRLYSVGGVGLGAVLVLASIDLMNRADPRRGPFTELTVVSTLGVVLLAVVVTWFGLQVRTRNQAIVFLAAGFAMLIGAMDTGRRWGRSVGLVACATYAIALAWSVVWAAQCPYECLLGESGTRFHALFYYTLFEWVALVVLLGFAAVGSLGRRAFERYCGAP